MRIKDIAEAAGVSTATVSRVLSDKPNVRPEVREKVMAVVKRLNYRPNRAARSLRSKQSSFIGLIVADIQTPFFASLSRAVEDVAQANDYSVILCNTDENPDKEKQYLDLMRSENAAGIILAPTIRLSGESVQRLADTRPLVLIDRKVKGAAVDTVLIDNYQAARELGEHMVGRGYGRIAGLFGISATGNERRLGFRSALSEAGVLDEKLIAQLPAKKSEGHAAVTRLLEGANPPQAVVTSNNLLGAGAFSALRDKDIEVPGQVAFATFDEAPWTTMIRPAITVVEQPTYAIGQTAGEMLFKRIEDPERPTRQVVLSSQLLVRQSCGGDG